MQRVLVSTIILFLCSFMLIGCTMFAPNDGRVVTEDGTPAKDDRIWHYEYQAERDRSAVWTDQYQCLSTIWTVASGAEEELWNYYAALDTKLSGTPHTHSDSTINFLHNEMHDAAELEDVKLQRALEKVQPLAKDLAYGNINLYQAFELITEVCDPYEHSQDDLDRTLAGAFENSESLSDLRLNVFGIGPEFNTDAGTYQGEPNGLHHVPNVGENFSEIEHSDDTCEQLLAGLIVQYAHEEINVEQVLTPFSEEHHEFLMEHLDFVQEEVESGRVSPDDAATLMGQVLLNDDCNVG